MVERALEMAIALSTHLVRVACSRFKGIKEIMKKYTSVSSVNDSQSQENQRQQQPQQKINLEKTLHTQRIRAIETVLKSQSVSEIDKNILTAAYRCATAEEFLKGIHVFRPHDQTELIAIVNNFPAFLESNSKVNYSIIRGV